VNLYLHLCENQSSLTLLILAAIASGDAGMVQRFKTDAELNTPDQDTFYDGDEKGYIDYPTLA
jgi:N-ethylmaleimide reductase